MNGNSTNPNGSKILPEDPNNQSAMDNNTDQSSHRDVNQLEAKSDGCWLTNPDSIHGCSEDRATYEIGRLMEDRSQLQNKLVKKDLTLNLWKKKERDYLQDIKSLRRRMDEMGKVIRSKETEIEHMRYVESQHLEEIRTVNLRLKEKRRPGITDPTQRQIQQEIENSSILTNRSIRLPTLVRKIDATNDTAYHCVHEAKTGNHTDIRTNTKTLPRNTHAYVNSREVQNFAEKQWSKTASEWERDIVSFSMEQLSKSTLPPNCFESVRYEEWVTEGGTRIHLPAATVVIPHKALTAETLISISKPDTKMAINEKIRETNLQDIAEDVMQLHMEPQGLKLKKDVHVDIANAKETENKRYLILQKIVNRSERSPWLDITSECAPRFLKSGALRINLKTLSAIHVLKLCVPVVSLSTTNVGPGYAIGKNAHPKTKVKAYYDDVNTEVLASILNDKLCYVDVSAYHDHKTKSLVVHMTETVPNPLHDNMSGSANMDMHSTPPSKTNDNCMPSNEWRTNKSSTKVIDKSSSTKEVDTKTSSSKEADLTVPVKEVDFAKAQTRYDSVDPIVQITKPNTDGRLFFLNRTSSRFPICDKDRLYFYFDGQKKWQLHSILNLDEILNGGRQTFKLPRSHKKGAAYDSLKLPKQVTITRRISDRVDEQIMCILNLSKSRELSGECSLTTDHLQEALSKVRIKVVQTVDIRYILDLMTENRIFNFEEQREIGEQKTPQRRAVCFLEKLSTKGAPGIVGFCTALEPDYGTLAQELRSLLHT